MKPITPSELGVAQAEAATVGEQQAGAASVPERGPEARAANDQQQALADALRALARREYSCVELRRRLGSKGHSDGVIHQVIEGLQADGSLSDERFAAEYVRSRIRKGYGPLRIRMELVERGIADRLAEEQLTQPASFWQHLAADACRRRFGATGADAGDASAGSGEPDKSNWNRRARFLSQRGFPADLIYRTLEGRLSD